jgi:hypothetical protein
MDHYFSIDHFEHNSTFGDLSITLHGLEHQVDKITIKEEIVVGPQMEFIEIWIYHVMSTFGNLDET